MLAVPFSLYILESRCGGTIRVDSPKGIEIEWEADFRYFTSAQGTSIFLQGPSNDSY